MAIRTYDILLDSYNSTMPEPIVGRQGDKNGAVTLHVTITDRGTAVDLTGQTVNLIAETAQGTAVVADNAGVTLTDATNGRFDYAVPNALWSEAGKITKAYFSLNDTNGQQTTYDLIFIVKKAIDTSQNKADDYITIIDGTMKSLQQKIDAMNTDVQTILNAYNQGDFYNKKYIDDFANESSDTLNRELANYVTSTGEQTSGVSALNGASLNDVNWSKETIGKINILTVYFQMNATITSWQDKKLISIEALSEVPTAGTQTTTLSFSQEGKSYMIRIHPEDHSISIANNNDIDASNAFMTSSFWVMWFS